MLANKTRQWIGILALFFLCVLNAEAQRVRGELHIEVRDRQGAAVAPAGELVSEANQFRRTFTTATDGHYVAQDLPFGVYRLSLHAEGFAPWSNLIEIRSEVPVRASITLGVAPVTTQVQVSDSATLVDQSRTGSIYSVGQQAIDEQLSPQPGRGLSELVNDQPGWLFEANGILHPRGSEYDVQYVLDGLPLTQNRSPAFAPAFDADDVESMRVLTANFPAEYGRKLGGIIEVTTTKDRPGGLHGQLDAGGGSFSTVTGSAALSYAAGKNRFSLSGDGFHTDRYLDPPVLLNFTNRGNARGFSVSYERDFSDHDRLRMRDRGEKVASRGELRLIGGQRQVGAVGQPRHADFDLIHEGRATAVAMRLTSMRATSSLGCIGQVSTPSVVTRWMRLLSPPMMPVPSETSLARIQSQCLRASLALAFSTTRSVSAANPMTSAGRLDLRLATVARMSGFSASSKLGSASPFLSL